MFEESRISIDKEAVIDGYVRWIIGTAFPLSLTAVCQ